MTHIKKCITYAVLTLGMLSCLAYAEDMPLPLTVSATVSVDLRIYALMSGQKANTSTGILTYQGKKYPFIVKGIGLNKDQIGASELVASGQVYNMLNPVEFAGRYFQISGGIDGNNGESKLRNDHNVWVHLEGWANGPIVISPNGALIEFTK